MSRIFIPLFFAFVFVSLQTAAQESARIKVELIPGGDGSYELVCTPDSRVIGSFSVRVVFDNLVNIKSSNVIVGVTTPGSVIRTLRPEDPAKNTGSDSGAIGVFGANTMPVPIGSSFTACRLLPEEIR